MFINDRNIALPEVWNKRIQARIEEQKKANRYRQRVAVVSEIDKKITGDKHSYINFSSNDYLGLSHHPRLIAAATESVACFGVGSGGSGHVTGYSEPLAQLESCLATWLGYERAIVFPSGFSANQAIIKLLIEREDRIIADRLSHASIMEAAILSPGRLHRFRHNDLQSLASYLVKVGEGNHARLVVTEGVFSMDGDIAPIEEIATLSSKHKALLVVDDAHGIGVLGTKGRGATALFNVKPDILVVTFGKGFGCSGAALLMSNQLAEYFTQFSKPLIYSTAIPPFQAAILQESLNLIESEEGDALREKLRVNTRYFQESLAPILAQHNDQLLDESERIYLLDSESAIQPLIIGEESKTLHFAQSLRTLGLWVSAIRPPTVPPQTSRLRITITADHSFAMIDQLIAALKQLMVDKG